MTMRASLIISARDQASSAFGRIAANARRMSEAFRPVQREAQAADRALERVGGSNVASRFARIGAAARRMASDLKVGERAAYGVGYALGWTARKSAGLALSTAKWGAAAGATGIGAGLGALLFGSIRVGAQFEQYETQLRTATKSASAAKAAMAWIEKFAETTPYELDAVTAAFIRAKNRGIDPMDGALRVLGDAASALNTPMEQAVDALGDAMRFQFERLLEYGITAQQAGEKVTFSWVQNGKSMSRSVRKDMMDVRTAVLEIMQANFGGGMDAQSRTLNGLVSNLSDKWTKFQKLVADAGIFDLVKSKLEAILSWADKASKDGRMKQWAERISDALERGVEWADRFINDTNWESVAQKIGVVAEGVWNIVDALASAINKLKLWRIDGEIAMNEDIANGWLTPSDKRKQALDTITRLRTMRADYAPDQREGVPKVTPGKGWKFVPRAKGGMPWSPAMQKQLDSATGAMRKGATKPLPSAPAKKTAAADVRVGGKVDIGIEVKAAPGTEVRTTRLASSNSRVVPTVRTGRAMAEPA